MAKAALETLRNENLPRTPYSVSLLLSVLLRAGSVSSNASHTAILDQYVSLLLGRGDPHEDARLGIEQTNREALLARLAEVFVNAASAGMPENRVVDEIQTTLDRLGWRESPSAILSNFVERRVLRRVAGNIVFGRSSYLYLFAAKRAATSGSFLTRLMEQALYYSPVLKAYAALTRHDATLVESVSRLLDSERDAIELGAPYALIVPTTAPPIEAPGDDSESSVAGPGSGIDLAPARSDGLEVLYELGDDADRPPVFPGEDPTELPQALRLMRAVDLVSTVLRDSDQVEDLDLKERVLSSVLRSWGALVTVVSEDQAFMEFARGLAEELEALDDHVTGRREAREGFLDDFSRALPSVIALGGIDQSLASRKLLAIFDRAMERDDVARGLDFEVAAMFFAYSVREPGWVDQVKDIVESNRERWIVRYFFLFFLADAYLSGSVAAGDEDALLSLCLDVIGASRNYESDHHRKQDRNRMKQDLERRRMMRKGSALLPSR